MFFKNLGPGRDQLIIEAQKKTALRFKNWVLIPPYNGPKITKDTNIEVGYSEEYQLYNLNTDIMQQNNLANSNPEKLEELINRYKDIIESN